MSIEFRYLVRIKSWIETTVQVKLKAPYAPIKYMGHRYRASTKPVVGSFQNLKQLDLYAFEICSLAKKSQNNYFANEINLFTLLSRCEVSLPQKATLPCRIKRHFERSTMKHLWKLNENPFGFMVLDRTPIEHVFKTFIDPFSRFNMEQYIQTVLTSDLTHSVYNVLVKNAAEIQNNSNYNILSKYFAMASKLGGVSIIFSSRRLWWDLIWSEFIVI